MLAGTCERSSERRERPASGVSVVVYDAAVLVAADRNERRALAEHRARLEFGVIATTRPNTVHLIRLRRVSSSNR